MTEADLKPFLEALVACGETFGEVLSATRQELYFEALRDLPLPVVQAGFVAAIRGSRFFPKPVELREAVAGSLSDQAEEAWGAFQVRCRDGGERAGLPEDPVAAAVVRVLWGTWSDAVYAWCYKPDVWLAGAHRDFTRLYAIYRRKPEAELPRLTGGVRLVLGEGAPS